ncbi:MAG: hypothetical protein ACP5SH_08545 [Syntrophobacteraceae bacterium]
MVWLETINIRSAGVIEARKVLELCSQIAESTTLDTALRVKVFCDTTYTTDISIHLEWNSDPGPLSVLGNELTEAFRDLGLINHTVWIEQEYPAGLPVLETGPRQNPAGIRKRNGRQEVSILGENRKVAHR